MITHITITFSDTLRNAITFSNLYMTHCDISTLENLAVFLNELVQLYENDYPPNFKIIILV